MSIFIEEILRANAPAMLDIPYCGPICAAQLAIAAGDNPDRMTSEGAFAALCGAGPIEASSGKVVRHRLNRGGDRQANRALHTIARLRMAKDEETKRYVERRESEGKSYREIKRVLVRYIAREVFRVLNNPMDTGCYSYRHAALSLKARRLALKETQARTGKALGVASARISELERSVLIDPSLLQRYRDWLERIEGRQNILNS